MRVLISGSHGLIGSEVVNTLKQKGHTVLPLTRAAGTPDSVHWNPLPSDIEAIVHLAGDPIAEGRWTEAKKKRIRESRVEGTRLLTQSILAMSALPKVVITASAIGFYGDRGDTVVDESSAAGHGFLADVCQGWESATRPLAEKGIRVVNLRIGFVLSNKGGGLAKMLLPFRLGVGGILGTGTQYMSWVSLDDVTEIVSFALSSPALKGPVNAVAPSPVTNREFTKTLGRVLHRPTLFPMPAFVARLVFGEMANELLLSSTRVKPEALRRAGYTFRHSTVDSALSGLIRE